ncbi:CaiB/BaiF CoA-transferase family protein [Saccharopolyspora sp. NPDC000359]|uniref:CaiB/BaiF CoA transferase family protein n=1 Tax=Saccharopolyspora sp. NPDC000359 TaxID=3154251 RepID=UPI00332F895A
MLDDALRGTKVLDLSRILAGPWCAQNLADLGADVIKVEKVAGGDDTRGWGPPYVAGTDPGDGFSAYFVACNRGKRSIAVDFSTPQGRDLIRRLAADADVVVENYRAGTLERHGLGYADLAAENPGLVFVSITGFGPTGPMAGKPGYDYVFQGMGGLMSYTGRPDGEPGAGPIRTGVAVVDVMTGMYATTAVLAALVKRAATGLGQQVDVALLDVAVALNANQAANYLVSGRPPERIGTAHPNCAPYDVFACSDGHLILAIGNDGQFARFCAAAGLDGLAADPRFATNSARLRNIGALRPVVAEVMLGRTRADWARTLDDAGVPWGPINDLAEVFADEQVVHRSMLVDTQHPVAGTIPVVRNPLVQSGPNPLPPPGVGEHTRQVLTETGLTDEQIEHLIREGVIGATLEDRA